MNAPARRFVPLYETVANELAGYLNLPGLSHIKTSVKLCQGDDKTSASIDFLVRGGEKNICLLSLLVNSDNSFVLVERGAGGQLLETTWTAQEAGPDTITPAVIAALRKRVVEPVAP